MPSPRCCGAGRLILLPGAKPNMGNATLKGCGAPCSDAQVYGPSNCRRSISVAVKGLAQPLQFEADAVQREQARHQEDAAPGRERDVGLPAKLRKMPEGSYREQGA